jgi:hypothetical protein
MDNDKRRRQIRQERDQQWAREAVQRLLKHCLWMARQNLRRRGLGPDVGDDREL